MRVGIVGGGLSGLVAAYYLRHFDPACQVRLFEAAARAGGVIRTERIDGYLLEHGADMFATQPDAALRLCRTLGIEDRLILPQKTARGAAIVDRGKLVRIPDGFVLMRPTRLMSMVTTPLLSPLAKLRLVAERFVPPRSDESDESIDSFVSRRLGRELLDRIVQPLVGGIYTGDVAKLSMAATMGQFLKMEREDGSLSAATRRRRREGIDSTERNSAGARYEQFRSFPGGLTELLESLVAALPDDCLQLSSPVRRLERDGEQWRLVVGDAEESFDRLIVATPAATAANLLREVTPTAAGLLDGIEVASSAIVALGVRAADIARPIDVAGFVVPIRERRSILAASFTGDKFAGRTPDGEKLIRVFFGGELQRELLNHDDDELVAIARRELADLIGLSGEPRLVRVIRWPRAMPQYHVGHLERVAAIERALTETPGLHLIGNSLRGVGIAPTVAAAEAVAQKIHAPNVSSQ